MSALPCPFGGCVVCEEGLIVHQMISGEPRRIRHMLREQTSLTISDDHGLLAKLVGVTMNYVKCEFPPGSDVVVEEEPMKLESLGDLLGV